MPKVTGKSWPVRTRWTPGWFSALAVSMAFMSACGCGERSSFMCSMRGRTMSSAKRVCPVTLARPSTRRRALPSTFIAHPDGSLLDRLEDLLVARAAAQVAGNRLFYPFPRGVRLMKEQGLCGHQDARRAVAALRRAEVGERGLQGVQ